MRNEIEKLSLGIFLISFFSLGIFTLKMTGLVISPEDPNPVYGLSLLVITLISAAVYFWLHLTNKKN